MYNLGDQFKMSMARAKAKKENMVIGNTYRFTVLTERLIRMEYSPKGIFYDQPSQLVLFRDFPHPEFTVRQDDQFLEITTKYFKLEYSKGKSFNAGKLVPMNNLKVILQNSNPEKLWYYGHPEVRNFHGIFTSVDGDKSNQMMQKGLYSPDGFVSFDDSVHMLFEEDGTLVDREEKYMDIYLFMYGSDFDLCLKDYFALTGKPSFVPRYALGNWWSRNYDYTDEALLELVDTFAKRDIPLSVILLDKDWHLREVKGRKGKVHKLNGGFTFNEQLIRDPVGMIKILHEHNIHIGLQVNPQEGIYPIEEFYDQALPFLNIESPNVIAFDPLNPRFMDVYMKLFLHSLEAKGVDFFWNDYLPQDGKTLPLWILNHYHFLDLARIPAKRGMLLARAGEIAPHRYPVLYSGETETSWEMLRKLPKLYQSAANIGVSWWSHDIAGNHGGIEDPELYIRSVQLGVFSPILRFHAARGRYYKREPWRWDIKTFSVVDDYLRLRHELIPYLYTEAYQYYLDGTPLITPLYYKIPWIYDDEVFANQYYFGKEMMVAPILNKKDTVMNRTIHKFYMPEGIWYDFKTGKKFPGKKQYISFFRDEDYPVFVKAGSIIPLSKESNQNNISNPNEFEIHIFPGQNNTYNLYEDDGVTTLYKDGYFLKTQIDYNYLPSNYTVIIRSLEGKSGLVPDDRDYRFRFRNTKQADEVIAYFNNSQVETTSYVEENDFVVEVKHVPSVGQLTINCKGKDIEIDAVRLINDDIDSILLDLQIDTYLKEKISEIMFSNLAIKKKRIEIRKLKKQGLSKEYVQLFLKLLEYIGEI